MSKREGCGCCGQVSEEQMLAQLDGILSDYKNVSGALIPVLQIAQGMFGYLPEAAA